MSPRLILDPFGQKRFTLEIVQFGDFGFDLRFLAIEREQSGNRIDQIALGNAGDAAEVGTVDFDFDKRHAALVLADAVGGDELADQRRDGFAGLAPGRHPQRDQRHPAAGGHEDEGL